jgi:preprotein translocase subunit SecA
MDHLRDATRFRGYAQKDPLQEYKKEGFEMFETTLERIAMEVIQRILHIDPDFLKRQQEAMIRARELEIARMRQMEFSAPDVSMPQGFAPPQPTLEGQERNGPREMPTVRVQNAPPRPAQPASRPGPQMRQMPMGPAIDVKNIGRNDPCPCGSGKKFKKCHGENL